MCVFSYCDTKFAASIREKSFLHGRMESPGWRYNDEKLCKELDSSSFNGRRESVAGITTILEYTSHMYRILDMEANLTFNDDNDGDHALSKARKLWLWVDATALDNFSFFLFCLNDVVNSWSWMVAYFGSMESNRADRTRRRKWWIFTRKLPIDSCCEQMSGKRVKFWWLSLTFTFTLTLSNYIEFNSVNFHGISSVNLSHHKSVADPIIVLFHRFFQEMFTPLPRNSRYSRNSSFRIV